MRLEDKVAIVTGVANPNGIAYASARKLAKEGAALAIVDVTPYVHERAKELKDAGYNVLAFQVDLTDSGKVKVMVGGEGSSRTWYGRYTGQLSRHCTYS